MTDNQPDPHPFYTDEELVAVKKQYESPPEPIFSDKDVDDELEEE